MSTIVEKFESICNNFLLENSSDEQIINAKMWFYSGFSAALTMHSTMDVNTLTDELEDFVSYLKSSKINKH